MIANERRNGIEILTMRHGKANALDVEFAEGLVSRLDALRGSDARGVVLTGTGRIFSAGVDLIRVVDGGAQYADRFLPALDDAFRSLFTLDLPVVAAINGHAIAGGCVLAQACDHRLMAEGPGRIGIPELLVGVPFPGLALEIVRNAVPAHTFREAVYFGTTYTAEQAVARGLVDALAPPDALLDLAVERAAFLARIPRDAFALTKQAAIAPALERAARGAAATDVRIAEVWRRDATRETIAGYVERTFKRKKS